MYPILSQSFATYIAAVLIQHWGLCQIGEPPKFQMGSCLFKAFKPPLTRPPSTTNAHDYPAAADIKHPRLRNGSMLHN